MLRFPSDLTLAPTDSAASLRELRRLRAEHRRLIRLGAVRAELIASCERELRGGLAQLMEDEALVDDPRSARAERRRDAMAGMQRALDRLLAAGQLGADARAEEPSECELGPILRACHDELRPVADAAGVTLELELPSSALPAFVDADRLHEGLAALLFDAIDAALVDDEGDGQGSTVLLHGHAQADEVVIELRRDGRQTTGTNLAPRRESSSLAAMRELAERHGGRLSLVRSSAVTRVTLVLPRAASPRETAQRGRVLLVEDDPRQAEVIAAVLEHDGHAVEVVYDAEDGLERARLGRPELVLLDVELSSSGSVLDGFAMAERLARDGRTREVPVIFLSARDEVDDKLRGLTLGAYDYLPKPFQARELLARVERALAMASERERLRTQARRDELTGLGNYRHLRERLAAACVEAARDGATLTLLLVDVDGFKRWNDEHGHAAGNEVLTMLGAALRDSVGEDHVAARFGGDELVALMPRTGLPEAQQRASQVKERFAALQRQRLGAAVVTLSMGIAERNAAMETEAPSASEAPGDALLRAADDALYRAKRRGGDAIEIAAPTTGVDPIDPSAPPGHEPELAAAGPPPTPPERTEP